MARTAQNCPPNPRPYQWRQREYLDHQGNPVIIGKVSRGQEFDAPAEIYASTQNDAFACVEHQRHEVAHRKRLYADSEQPPNFVP
ncbi:hypothetical protein N7478_011055 [Penicillium angulare]|uniref:uncharacterized protein n=1 Tax=Penicillium angulare TaxID=116970 RepID=UPI00254082B5|nr:uncharacterized protein N7478_011055 [Penicillium angulare]KAJ5263450.1 hypothetical protein N7478_011055 [Penicillium angulare]